MRTFCILLFIITLFTSGWSQSDQTAIVYTAHFTELASASGLEIQQDSLEQYLLTDSSNPYLKNTDLYLTNPQSGREYIVIVDKSSPFPQLKFSSHVTNLMNNENEHQVAFYSLDEYFILTELHADWAADAQFVPKDQEEITGYARSFYNAETGVQVTIILLAGELPLLSTPAEMMSIRFKEDE